MKTREEALNYGLSFPNTYMEMPFHDPNWQLVRSEERRVGKECRSRWSPYH